MKKNSNHMDSKKKDIVKAATYLFATKGIDGTSVKEIGNHAGVTDAAIYKHFTSKKEVVREVFSHYYRFYTQLMDYYASQPLSFRHRFNKLIEHIIESFQENKYGLLLLDQHHEYCNEIAETQRLPVTAFADFIRKGVENEEIPEQNADLSAVLLVGALTRMTVFIEMDFLLIPSPTEIRKRLCNLIGLL